MEQLKRQRSNSFYHYDDATRKKIQVTTVDTNCLSREILTHFEDLSNEIIYEIFEFLDYFHVYKAFFNFNRRFRNLLTNSTLPIKINISSMSKSTLQRYYKDIITPNKQRINSICISDLFMYEDRDFPLFYKTSRFPRLETLVLDNIEPNCLENLLLQLTSLPLLSSLIIATVDRINNVDLIYCGIFGLSALKYCKLSFKRWSTNDPLPFSINKCSSIEHLVIDYELYLHQLNGLLSYVPQLRRLSFRSLYKSWNEQTKMYPTILNHLTHVSLGLNSIKFDQFEQLFVNIFSSVQVLHISAGIECMDGNRWRQLILSHLPNLRIFDILLNIHARNDDDRLRIEDQIDQFTSSFWIERQWFFKHCYYHSSYGNRGIFYSTNPYRRKHYTFCEQQNKTTWLSVYETHLNSVDEVYIQNENEMINCMNYFPNATKLICEDGFSINLDAIATILTRIIPLKQLKNLVIKCHHLSFIKVIELLQFTPNIHTLIFKSMPFYKNDYLSIQQSETFRLVSIINSITNVTCKEKCTLEKLKLLVALCPRVQRLTIYTLMKDMEPIIRWLLERTNQGTSHLVSLYFSRASKSYFRNLNALVKSGRLPRDCMLKYVDSKLYLWW